MVYHADSSDLGVKEVLTWEGFGIASRELAQQIVGSNFNPEIIIAVTRDGLLPAGVLSYTTGAKLSDATDVKFYADVAETPPDPILLEPLLDVELISDRRLLVVDDVAGSDHALRLVFGLLKNCGAEVRPAVFYGKSRLEIAPSYIWEYADDWTVFPWSAELPIQGPK